ncbi:MAG: LamG-like jellyroll fold domain-containing protein [Sedimentisphaeraceae bacterium JB056]
MKFKLAILLSSVLSTMLFAGTVAYYDFEEGFNGLGATGTAPTTSGWVLDSAGSNNATAAVSGGYPAYIDTVAFRSMGSLGMRFAAKYNGITIPNSAAVQWSENASKTLEFYIRRDGNGPDGSTTEFIMSKGYTSSGGWQIYFYRTAKTIRFQVQSAVMESTTSFEDMVWHHVAITHEANSGIYELYVDYEKEAEITGFSSGSVTTPTLLVGKGYGWMDQRVFNGAMDDIRISDEVLIPADFVYRNVTAAYTPQPADGSQNIANNVTLSWTSGDFALTHKVYLGTDYEAVLNATEVSDEYMGEVSVNEYSPALELGQTYYWRVDEINDSYPESPWTSEVWSFTVQSLIVIDDFESYADESAIDAAWTFSDADPNNLQSSDSAVGATTLYSGDKGMQIAYDLADTSDVSSTSFSPAVTDWTVDDVRALSFYAMFEAGSVDADIIVSISDSAQTVDVLYEDSSSLNDGQWHAVYVSLDDFVGLDLTDVQGLTISLTNATGTGYLYVDYVNILQGICTEALSADMNGDCRVDILDLSVIVDNWADTTLWP